MTDGASAAAPESLAALSGRTDLAPYGNNAHVLFALELAFGLEDIDAAAAQSLTDGPNDKKCDLVHVDRDLGKAVIAQGYWSTDAGRAAAPANKASDLNVAAAWLFGADMSQIPSGLQGAASELRSALEDGAINQIEFWYVHNLPESQNVANELEQVERAAHALLDAHYPNAGVNTVRALEVGLTKLESWFRSAHVAIIVTDIFEIPVPGGFEERGDRWKAFCTTIPAALLRDLIKTHGSDLFSANVRGYLGSIKSERNINNNIKRTARDEPTRFWVYNNGMTALVNKYELVGHEDPRRIRIHGVSIVNGAQTTGALGALDESDVGSVDQARVLARFVECSDRDVINDIIKYNNSQNVVEPFDFRSGDVVQRRLVEEFAQIPDAEYRGFRRGGERDQIERPANLVASSTAAQALVAFHGDPTLAYNEKGKISEDSAYPLYFNDATTAGHIVFCYSLYKAIEEAKRNVNAVPEGNRTTIQRAEVEFFSQRGSLFLVVRAVSVALETVLGGRIADPFKLVFKGRVSPKDASAAWAPVIGALLPFVSRLAPALEGNLKHRELIGPAVSDFASLVEAAKSAAPAAYEEFAQKVES